MNISRPIVRFVSTMTLICMSIAMFFGCATAQNSSNPAASTSAGTSAPATSAPAASASETSAAPTAPAEKKPVTLEMSVFWQNGSPFTQPENDIVGKAIQEHSKYTIKLKDVFYEKNGNWTEEYNLFAAANNFPDVCQFPASGIDTVAKFSDYFYDLKDYITDVAKSPNMHKYNTSQMIASNQKYKTQDGKYLGWPIDVTPDFSDPAIQSQYNVWYHNAKSNGSGSSVMAREDILKQLGYTFTPVKDLISKVESTNAYLTPDDLKLNPPVETTQQLEDLFTKAKALELKTKDGSPVSTLSGSSGGLTFWFGGVFAFDFFRKLPDGTVTAYYGGPYAKDYFKTMNGWYRKGFVDKDMFLAKADQITAKISNGGAAFWMSGRCRYADTG